MAGQSQLGMIGATVVATAAIQGNKDLVMIGGVTNVMAFAVAARPGIESPQTIKGKNWPWRDSAEPPTSLWITR